MGVRPGSFRKQSGLPLRKEDDEHNSFSVHSPWVCHTHGSLLLYLLLFPLRLFAFAERRFFV